MAKQIGLCKKTNKHDHSHTLKTLSISTTWRNSFNFFTEMFYRRKGF